MPTIVVGKLSFRFPPNWNVSQFDEWEFYRNQFQKVCGGAKAVDIVAIHPKVCLWAIEVKDYRTNRRTKTIDMADEVALKIRDSLAALVAAKVRANDMQEKRLAGLALRCPDLRVVLHLEQPAKQSKLFPRAIDPAAVCQRLKQLLKAIDPHPLVVEIVCLRGVAWSVS
jgi:hypothetical protein